MYVAQYEWYNEDVNSYNYNLTKANELLDQAGFGTNTTDPLRNKLNFTISYNDGNLLRKKICQFAHDQWVNLGIGVEIESTEWITMLMTQYDDRNFDAMISGWIGGGGDPDLTGVWSSLNIMPGGQPIGLESDGTWLWSGTPNDGGLNYMSYWNPTVDELMFEAKQEDSINIRKEYYDLIQEMIVDDSPYIWLFSQVNMIAVNPDFYGFVQNSIAGFWPEPIGFRNIYYAPEDSNDSSTTTKNEFTSSFELMSVTLSLIGIALIFKKRKY